MNIIPRLSNSAIISSSVNFLSSDLGVGWRGVKSLSFGCKSYIQYIVVSSGEPVYNRIFPVTLTPTPLSDIEKADDRHLATYSD